MASTKNWIARLQGILTTLVAIILTVIAAMYFLGDRWQSFVSRDAASAGAETHDAADPHAGHDHSSHGADAGESIELSDQARKNLRLQTMRIAASRYTEYLEIPATVVDWPGQTHLAMTAPLTGVVNAIYVSRGELIRSGRELLTLRLTHQDLVNTQEEFLKSLGQVDVEQREIARLENIAKSGAVAGKTLIQREYERDKLLASVKAARQSMLLHGLSEPQINEIEQTRKLIREVKVYVPVLHADRSLHHDSIHPHDPSAVPMPPAPLAQSQLSPTQLAAFAQPTPSDHEHIESEFVVTELAVNLGQSVVAGEHLGRMSDYSNVLVEGHAFQSDAETLRLAADSNLPLQAVFEPTGSQPIVVEDLHIAYIGNEIDRQSRSMPFFVPLKNEIERSEKRGAKQYVSWRYKPGQRLQLRVPSGGFDNVLVVPKDAVAEEGPERYVFIENGSHFERRSVHVLARDAISVAIANDGSVLPGQVIATRGAHQMQMALKNQAGGAIDPHAGHNH
tara:strand:- start:103644 stop:105164 length:1521 start_codon:yes stop_codon:yes gene_type:complete